jgi:hypothetical protein
VSTDEGTPRFIFFLGLALSLSILPLILLAGAGDQGKSVTEPDVKALIEAIEDEIYDYGYEGWTVDVSKHLADQRYQLNAYVKPVFNDQNLGWVIYKLMPDGEVLRMFSFRTDHLAVLDGNPEEGFRPTQPSYLTVFMDDDDLCQAKREWIKITFEIQLHPSQDRLRQAAERQKRRKGHSVLGGRRRERGKE